MGSSVWERTVQRECIKAKLRVMVIHISALEARDTKNSPLWRHCVAEHGGEMQEFGMTVTGSYRNDTMLRQITEAVQINNMDPNTLMNDRAEWNMTRIPRAIVTAV